MYVMIVKHPMGHLTEVLFSKDYDKTSFRSLDGLKPSYFTDICGLDIANICYYPKDSVVPFRLMAASLAEKIKSLHLYCKYKDEQIVLSKLWHVAKKLQRLQATTFGEELDLPEIVIALGNAPLPRVRKEFSSQ